jgi:SH3-like domain-containing protein
MVIDSRTLLRVVTLSVALAAGFAAAAADAPHYASIRRDKAYMREGPSYAHKILWVFQHKDYPLRIVASYDAWRRVKDVTGAVGWMHHTQLSDKRTVLFIGFTRSPLRNDGDPTARIVAYAQPGVVAHLKACKPQFCEVDADGTDGWVDKRNIWGVDVGEVFP